tara:strand:- start:252 stop:854 length:603 start_codon:yes stop_codon:yes gene_type:complete
MSQTKAQLIDAVDGSIVDADIAGLTSSKLSGALPAISGASLTNLPASGITMYDSWRITTDVQGTQQPLSSNWERNDTNFDKIGTGMTQSSGVFTFPTTGKYHIWYKINFYTNGNNSNYVGAYLEFTTGGSYANLAYSYDQFGGVSGYYYATAAGDSPFDVTDVSSHKIRLHAGMQSQSVYVMGTGTAQATGLTFMRIGDT